MRTGWVKFMLAVLVVGMTATAARVAPAGDFGAGIILGEPTGLTAKLWIGRKTAVDAAVAWSFSEDEALYLHANYLYHFFHDNPDLPEALSAYIGAGGKIVFRSDTELGIRVPVGLSYLLGQVPIEVFLEVAPGVLLIPETDADIGAGIGVRYFF